MLQYKSETIKSSFSKSSKSQASKLEVSRLKKSSIKIRSDKYSKEHRGNIELGIFVDGTSLDRASRRIFRKINLSSLMKGVSSGLQPAFARYYTIIPFEDDARHLAFLDAVRSSGYEVIVKRLPPKGMSKMVTVDLEMATDIIAFSMGHPLFRKKIHTNIPTSEQDESSVDSPDINAEVELEDGLNQNLEIGASVDTYKNNEPIERRTVIVCPSKELSYPISLVGQMGVNTTTADFGTFNYSSDVLKSATNWIDLTDSPMIFK